MIQERRHPTNEVLQAKKSTPEKPQPTQSDTVTGTQQHQFSSDDDDSLPDPFPAKTFKTKSPKDIPKKSKLSPSQK